MKKLVFVGLADLAAAENAVATVAPGLQDMAMSKGRADPWHFDEIIRMSATSTPAGCQ